MEEERVCNFSHELLPVLSKMNYVLTHFSANDNDVRMKLIQDYHIGSTLCAFIQLLAQRCEASGKSGEVDLNDQLLLVSTMFNLM